MYLFPKTKRKSTSLKAVDIAVRKPTSNEKPESAHIIYIEEGKAHYATTMSPQSSNGRFDLEFTIGPAEHVAIEFDVKWELSREGNYRPITTGEPWLFRVHDGKLLAQKGETTTPLELDSGNITYLSAVRGWQNLITPHEDHGLVLLYIKDGKPYYNNYSLNASGQRLWSGPQLIPGFAQADRITGFRSNDYRLVLLISAGKNIHQVVSTRNWAGMGIKGERATAYVDKVQIDLIPMTYHSWYEDVQSRARGAVTPSIDFGPIGTDNTFLNVYNPDAFNIVLDLESPLYNLNILDFRVMDAKARTFKVNKLNYNKLGPRLVLEMEDFNNARGDLTIQYLGDNGTTNILGVPYKPFEISFAPVGLEPVDIPLPQVVKIINVEG